MIKERNINSTRFNQALRSAMIVLLISICCVYRIQIAGNDTDPLWHYKLGEEIVKTGRISLENHFTWQTGTTWNQQEWLFDVILYLVVHYFGFAGFQIMLIVGHCIGFLICYRVCRPSTKPEKALFLCAFLVFCLFSQNNRPACYSVYCLILWMAMYEKEMSLVKRAAYSLLLGLFITNFHGGNVTVMIALYLLSMAVECILWFREKKPVQWIRLRDLTVSLLCFAGAACVCPMGWKSLTYTFSLLDLNTTGYINEWRAYPLSIPDACLILFVCFLLGVYAHTTAYDHKAVVRIVYTLYFTAVGICQSRGMPPAVYLWLCFCLPYTARGLRSVFSRPDSVPEEKAEKTAGDKKLKKSAAGIKVLHWAVWAAGFALAVSLLSSFLQKGGYPTFDEYADQSWAEETLYYLEEHHDSDTRILAPYASNSVLMYHDIPVTVDPRQTPYDSDTNQSLMDVITVYFSKNRSTVYRILEKYDFDYIVTDSSSSLEWYLDTDFGYQKVAEGISKTGVHQTLYEKR